MKIHILRIRASDRNIFKAVQEGKKKIETRAATGRNIKIQKGDQILFICGKEKLQKKVSEAARYKTVKAMLKDYRIKDIAPEFKTENELRDMYFAWPSYRDKIKKYGLIAFELK